jgi:hypothetical protein
VSNVYAVAGQPVDWAELAAVIGARFPDRPLVGYEHGHALDAALAGGFLAVGELRVWVRSAAHVRRMSQPDGRMRQWERGSRRSGR